MKTSKFVPILLVVFILTISVSFSQTFTLKREIMSNSAVMWRPQNGDFIVYVTGSQLAVDKRLTGTSSDLMLYQGIWKRFEDPNNTSVESDNKDEFKKVKNTPNPFSVSTQINYTLPAYAKVRLVVYDVNGNEVARLIDGYQEAGSFNIEFNAKTASGAELASGSYLYELSVEPAGYVSSTSFAAYTVRNVMVLAK